MTRAKPIAKQANTGATANSFYTGAIAAIVASVVTYAVMKQAEPPRHPGFAAEHVQIPEETRRAAAAASVYGGERPTPRTETPAPKFAGEVSTPPKRVPGPSVKPSDPWSAEARTARQLTFPTCRDKNADCAAWASRGECEKNQGYMKLNCALSCDSCDWADYTKRCKKDPNETMAVPVGAVDALFGRIEAGDFDKYKARIVSRDPWLAVLEDFVPLDEVAAIRAVAQRDGEAHYVPSQGTAGLDDTGSLIATNSNYRTSSTNWCNEGCVNESAIISLRNRVAELTGVPDVNHEYPQMLRYRESQYYKEHSDYIPAHRDMPCGPRVYTVFVYLSDVEEGGQTHFPRLKTQVDPKPGRAVIWPSVFNDRPMDCDMRTVHIAEPVTQGVKYSVNFWLHQFNFKDNHALGCTG